MGYCHNGYWHIDWLAYPRIVKELVMQRLYNWLVISFLCFATFYMCYIRSDVNDNAHALFISDRLTGDWLRDIDEDIIILDREIANFKYIPVDKYGERISQVPDVYQDLQDISVKVVVGSGSGSGVLFCRDVAGEWRTFVWTAGHVVKRLLKVDGTFRNATIKYEDRYPIEQRVVKWEQEAKVIACSNSYDGEDLALLEIIDNDYRAASVTFASDEIQKVGTEIIHVGSAAGFYNSVSLGIVSQTDREYRGKMYDQTSTMAYPGSSGGGVYTTDGKCIGLVTLGVGPGLNFYVPVRRMRAWAKKEGIEWAMDLSVPVPLSRTPTELEMSTGEPEG